MLLNIPIGHIHGGELTEAAFDDSIRHSITKMAHLHFVSNNTYKKRVMQLGENKKNIHVVGCADFLILYGIYISLMVLRPPPLLL